MSTVNLLSGGLDVQNTVDQLIYVEREPVRRLQTQTTTLQSKISAYQSLNTKLSSLLDKVNTVLYNGSTIPLQSTYDFDSRLKLSIFGALQATSSDSSVVAASASKGTATGAFSVTVSSLAQARSVAADGFADTTTTRTGTGTLIFQVGTKDPVTLAIDSSNNTLEGIRRTINAANAGVTATIVNDGSASPYKLVISATDTGTANSFTVTDNLAGGTSLNLTEKVSAADAHFRVNGIDVTKSSNTVTDVIDGVSLTLKNVSAAPVLVSVDRDFDQIVSALQDVITSYNDVNAFANSQTRYDSKTKAAGVLSGDGTLRSTQMKLLDIFAQSVNNSYTAYRIITQVGFTFNNDGSVTLDEAKLRAALAKNPTQVAALLLGDGRTGTPDSVSFSDSRLSYMGSTPATLAGTYTIEVTASAAPATVTAAQAFTTLVQNENLTVTYNGTSASVSLTAGDTFASTLQKINDALAANGIQARAEDNGTGRLQITSTSPGSSQTVSVVSDLAAAPGTTGFGATLLSGTGADIAGTINGHEAAGKGLQLTGAAGQPEEGLRISISPNQAGSYGTVTFAPGVAASDGPSVMVNLRTSLKFITDPLAGPIHNSTDSLNQTIRRINDQISEYEARLEVRREFLTNEFSRADQALRLLTVTQTSLSNQINSLSSMKWS